MWSQITLKTKIIKHRLIMCQCEKCGKKKWSQRKKKSNKVLSLIVINACIWIPVFDGLTSSQVMVFENAQAATMFEETESVETAQSVSRGSGVDGIAAQSEKSVAGTVGGTHVSSVSGSAAEIIKRVASESDIDWKILWAVCQVESQCNPERIGDGGHSHGAFQIYLKVHKNITKEQARDISFAAKWTAKHCATYKNDVRMFAKCHNGIAKTTNGWYMDRVENVYKTLND